MARCTARTGERIRHLSEYFALVLPATAALGYLWHLSGEYVMPRWSWPILALPFALCGLWLYRTLSRAAFPLRSSAIIFFPLKVVFYALAVPGLVVLLVRTAPELLGLGYWGFAPVFAVPALLALAGTWFLFARPPGNDERTAPASGRAASRSAAGEPRSRRGYAARARH